MGSGSGMGEQRSGRGLVMEPTTVIGELVAAYLAGFFPDDGPGYWEQRIAQIEEAARRPPVLTGEAPVVDSGGEHND
jgi:hypothetical protein